ncbi:MAG: GTPase obg, partial [Candidatus Peregrinibacteria bacterium GW2011_GWA2_44_7]
GGPDGGDGGRGGHLIFKVDPNLNSLIHLRKKSIWKAEPGQDGHRFNKAGHAGEDLILNVPPGTLVYDQGKNKLLFDLVDSDQEVVFLEGGKGGFGNAHFVSSVRQAPLFGEKGEPGASIKIRLEMRMVADVGLIGLPSVGKSTLISRITDAKPKIADYPFTTLIPNMGVVALSRWGGSAEQTFVVADIPGLIEGAHQGKGLGDEFLRHVSRTSILVHLLDCQSVDPFKDYEVIMNELKLYDPELAKRPQILVLNKMDTLDQETADYLMKELKSFLVRKKKSKLPLFSISGISGQGLSELVFYLFKEVQKIRKAQKASPVITEEVHRVFRPHLEEGNRGFSIEEEIPKRKKEGAPRAFRVTGKRIEQIVVMSPLENDAAMARIYDIMKKMGITPQLRKKGATVGDLIRIGEGVFEFRG